MARKEDNQKREIDQPAPSENDEANKRGKAKQHKLNLLERIVSSMSALLLAAAIGYLVWEGVTYHEPPSFDVHVDQIWEADGRYHLLLAVENTGGESVQALRLEVRLQQGDSTVAIATGNLSWLPARSTRKVAVIFTRNPRRYEIVFKPKSYELP